MVQKIALSLFFIERLFNCVESNKNKTIFTLKTVMHTQSTVLEPNRVFGVMNFIVI